MYSTYTKADAYLDPLLVTEVSAETMDSYIHLKKNKGNRNFIFKFIQARKSNAKSTFNFLWRQRFHTLFLCRRFKAEIRHPMRKQGNLTPLIHLKMHMKKLNTFNNCLMA